MRLTRRAAFTIIEILVSLTVGAVGVGLLTATLVRQQRFYSGASQLIEMRSQLRDASDILASDIRGAAIAQFGLPIMLDTAIEMYSAIGTSVACSIRSSTTIGLPPSTLAAGHTLTSFVAQPDTGDVALIYSVHTDIADSARWDSYRIAAFGSRTLSSSCPVSTGFTTAGDSNSGSSGYVLTLAQPVSANLPRGAWIHFVRRVRYSFYRSSDGAWYLGYRRCGASGEGCAAIQPVSGPYRQYRSGGKSGVWFRYFDANGVELTPPAPSTRVARVDIVIRGETSGDIAIVGDTRQRWADSAVTSVSPRNRRR